MTAITSDLISRFDVPGPRYTSYPTADRFVDAFSEQQYLRALQQRRRTSSLRALPLSLYVHIPFCESLCYYCACNKIITRHKSRGQTYLDYLQRELQLNIAQLGAGQSVSQVHIGGGTPTFLGDEELKALVELLQAQFHWVPAGEYSIEVDPRTVDENRLRHLHALGFNRLSFGVQDLDPEVQRAVHRIQPAHQIFDLVAQAREIGFDSVNIDLIYGLPRQTPDSFADTLRQMQTLRPDRIALYGYAHLPGRFKPQRRIHANELPSGAAKVGMLAAAASAFEEAGYVHVGMDHFALPEDVLAIAKRQGRLHRNFQGYSTQPDCDLIALGVSAIGRVGASYSQNAKNLEDYCDAIDQGHLPVARGLALTRDDLLRRAVIMALMCQGRVQFESFNLAWLVDFGRYFEREMERLQTMQTQGLVRLSASGIEVTPMGWFFVRAIAMVFDRYLQNDHDRMRFSCIL
jgi:oxygen-independent coproporphyrinogen-3 oxidase